MPCVDTCRLVTGLLKPTSTISYNDRAATYSSPITPPHTLTTTSHTISLALALLWLLSDLQNTIGSTLCSAQHCPQTRPAEDEREASSTDSMYIPQRNSPKHQMMSIVPASWPHSHLYLQAQSPMHSYTATHISGDRVN